MATRNALGKGLGALIEDYDPQEKQEVEIMPMNEINIDDIDVNPYQPRKNFNQETLEELSQSIKKLGVIQPITVRKTDDNKFQLIAGERRLRASSLGGLKTIPAYVRTADDPALLELSLVENIQREDLDAIEVALSYQRLIEECSLTQENMSERVGKKRSTVTNYLRLLKLPPDIQFGIRQKLITMGHARSLINIEAPKDQVKIYQRIIKEGLSVRRTEEIIRDLGKENKPVEKKASPQIPDEYNELKDHLARRFNAGVDLKISPKGAGKIIISFKTNDELERIMEILDKTNA